jgi:hypothetical protein
MTPNHAVCATTLLVCLFGSGCDTSSHDVLIEDATATSDPRSLSVAWASLEQRLDALEAELRDARADTRLLCLDGAPAEHPVCRRLAAMDDRVAELVGTVQTLDGTVESVDQRVALAERTLGPVRHDAASHTVTFTGVNVHIRNGGGATDTADGTGNLVLGWNEADDNDTRTGSHNVIVGSHHAWTGTGGLLVGQDHALLADGAVAIGGEANTVVVGGEDNHSTAIGAVGLGGAELQLRDDLDVVFGGLEQPVDANY